MKKIVVDIITLGCSKNLVDSERLMRQLELEGFGVTHDEDNPKGDIAVVNTCGFIGDAKEESINMILQMARRKKDGNLRKLYVMGCLSERYMKELRQEIPEVDAYYGKFDWETLLRDLGKEYHGEASLERCLTTPSHYAYLKISEGCDRNCSYCAIPIITGKHRSRPMDDILQEVRLLVSQGVREFQVIAQELTYYGLDLYGKRMIAELVDAMARIEGVEWIRLHYAYPSQFPLELLDVMASHDNVCKYMDIALQHISDNILQSMHRHIDKRQTYALIQEMRRRVPGIHLRTTLMVGFPGETDEDYRQLLDFVRDVRFERMGAFAYSAEDGTFSGDNLADDVPEEVKQARLSKLMRVQQTISMEVQASKVGSVFRVMIDRKEGEYYVGRTEYDSPEVDPEVLIRADSARPLVVGNFYDVKIYDSDDFDLYGHVV